MKNAFRWSISESIRLAFRYTNIIRPNADIYKCPIHLPNSSNTFCNNYWWEEYRPDCFGSTHNACIMWILYHFLDEDILWNDICEKTCIFQNLCIIYHHAYHFYSEMIFWENMHFSKSMYNLSSNPWLCFSIHAPISRLINSSLWSNSMRQKSAWKVQLLHSLPATSANCDLTRTNPRKHLHDQHHSLRSDNQFPHLPFLQDWKDRAKVKAREPKLNDSDKF